MQRLVLCSAILASSLIFAAVSIAQSPSPCFVFASGIRIYDKANVKPPFSATIQTTYEQKLADGNSIRGILITHEYRDTSGRIRTESSMRCVLGLDGQFHPDLRISVSDPGAGTTIWWEVNGSEKTAHIVHPPKPTAAAPLSSEQRQIRALTQASWTKNTRHESLGTRTIAGFLTEGSRQITTTPAGEQGNEEPLENSDEVWFAADTGIAMLSIQEGPRSGRTTQEVTDLQLGEPDVSLFAPPVGYRVEEQRSTP